jgi:hypothetical protein
MDDTLDEMILAGHAPLRAQGFSVPCYVTRPGANRWYVALCSIDGDHAATIIGFEPFDGDVTELSSPSQRVVTVGNPWHDVLVWNGVTHVGTPEIILEQLDDQLEEIAQKAPLTLLDLSVAVDAPDLPVRQAAAYRYLETRFDKTVADHWQAELFVRQRTMIEARRLVRKARSPRMAGAIRLIEVGRSDRGLTIAVPPEVAAALEQAQTVDAFSERVDSLSSIAGIGLKISGLPDSRADAAMSDAVPALRPVQADLMTGGSVLIIMSGPKAKVIGRHLGKFEWRPDWNVPEDAENARWNRRKLSHRRDVTVGLTDLPQMQVIDEHMAMPKLDDVSTVIWVADDESVARDWGRSLPAELRAAADQGLEPLCILAPVLPPSHPSRILARSGEAQEVPPFYTILDTATARSPFWGGNPKRSIDRRVADLVIAAAVLTVPDSPLRAYLSTDRPRYEPLLLSIASGTGRGPEAGAGMASEVSPAGLDGFAPRRSKAEWFAWIERPETGSRRKGQLGRACVDRHEPNFRPFAQAVVATNRRLAGMAMDERLAGEVPPTIEKSLSFPEFSTAFRIETKRSGTRGCVVTAEAPDLKSLRAAAEERWQLCRYSDEEGLADLVEGRRSALWQLPRDIRLPQLNRLGRNKGLAIRGVDPRDVVRLPAETFKRWHDEGGADLDREIRWYRTEPNRYREPPESAGMAALPVAIFRGAEDTGHPAAEFLRNSPDVFVPAPEALARRTADLRASWEPPERRTRRYMLEDGRLPVRFGLLDDREVAAQKFFTLDGDGSIVALLLSKMFAIWAGATLSRSPSWSSRFSVTKTFETFPIPDQFMVLRDGEAGRASLHLSRTPGAIRQLVQSLESEVEMRSLHFPGRRSESRVPHELEDIINEIDSVLLREMGLDEKADELTILERMISLNRSA